MGKLSGLALSPYHFLFAPPTIWPHFFFPRFAAAPAVAPSSGRSVVQAMAVHMQVQSGSAGSCQQP